MADFVLEYPENLPVSREREAILSAWRDHQVLVVVGDTGSGKTTQLPKMAIEAALARGVTRGRTGCSQPRRIAAASVARRVAEEMRTPLGGAVGYQVRFQEKVSRETVLKFMTDGILLAETQGDPLLRQYHTLIIDEAHERSLNIDFLLGYLKRLLSQRTDLKLIISSATLDAGGFSEFFDQCPVVEVEGRTFPVEVEYLPPESEQEDLSRQVRRAVEWIDRYDHGGDVLVFLPGEREIRECTDVLVGQKYANTEICPLFARLGFEDQQRIFTPPAGRRRIILATNVAETSLTIPGIVYVVDTGVARVSRWNPGRQIQRLQVEPVSQASARQRKGRCGRIREGICLRLYGEEDFESRPEFTDPEIRRSSLAGVILKMKALRLPEIDEFPFLDPPKSGAITQGYRTLMEIGALDRNKALTETGKKLARIPVEPRLGRMILAGEQFGCLDAVLIIVSGLTVMDPRERPAEKQAAADKAHQRWADQDSDFLSCLNLWNSLCSECREDGKWKKNRLRKFCTAHFLNFRRVLEWENLYRELSHLVRDHFKWSWSRYESREIATAEYQLLHEAILAGIPRQFGLIKPETKDYTSATGGSFAIFPGSGLFGKKKPEWLLAFDMVETTRIWARRVAKLDPRWVENVAPHLCQSRYYAAAWNLQQGAVYAKEDVICGGLIIVKGRGVHYGRIDPGAAREIFIREGLLEGGLIKEPGFVRQIKKLREEVEKMEQKLRRRGGLWHDDAIYQFLNRRIPEGMCTAKDFHRWVSTAEKGTLLMPQLADVMVEDPAALEIKNFPDFLEWNGEHYPWHYRHAPGEEDDGLTLEIALSQLHAFPEWLPSWGVWGNIETRVIELIRCLPKVLRVACQPLPALASAFREVWTGWEPRQCLLSALAEFISEKTGKTVAPDDFEVSKFPDALVPKFWVYDDETGEEAGFGTCLGTLKGQLKRKAVQQFDTSFGAEWEKSGCRDWQFGDLPASVPAGIRLGYPGLVDEGSSVGLKLFLDPSLAAESHFRGCARLFLLRHPDLKKYLEKNLPMRIETRMMLPLFGEKGVSNEHFILLSATGALPSDVPRSGKEFSTACEKARADLYHAAAQLGKWLDQSVEHYRRVDKFFEDHRGDEALAENLADMEEQVRWLLREGFLLEAGWEHADSYPRYFRALEERIARLQSHPLVRDLEKMDRIHPILHQWEQISAEQDDPVRMRRLRFAIEELRVSLFAPGVPVKGKVSEKRLEKEFEELMAGS